MLLKNSSSKQSAGDSGAAHLESLYGHWWLLVVCSNEPLPMTTDPCIHGNPHKVMIHLSRFQREWFVSERLVVIHVAEKMSLIHK